jgi:hypothetical protein
MKGIVDKGREGKRGHSSFLAKAISRDILPSGC